MQLEEPLVALRTGHCLALSADFLRTAMGLVRQAYLHTNGIQVGVHPTLAVHDDEAVQVAQVRPKVLIRAPMLLVKKVERIGKTSAPLKLSEELAVIGYRNDAEVRQFGEHLRFEIN